MKPIMLKILSLTKKGAKTDLGYMIFIRPPAKALKTKLLDMISDRNSVDSDRLLDTEFIIISGTFKNSMRKVAPAVCSGNFKIFMRATTLGTRLQKANKVNETRLFNKNTYNA